jgi:hypothetical protein
MSRNNKLLISREVTKEWYDFTVKAFIDKVTCIPIIISKRNESSVTDTKEDFYVGKLGFWPKDMETLTKVSEKTGHSCKQLKEMQYDTEWPTDKIVHILGTRTIIHKDDTPEIKVIKEQRRKDTKLSYDDYYLPPGATALIVERYPQRPLSKMQILKAENAALLKRIDILEYDNAL